MALVVNYARHLTKLINVCIIPLTVFKSVLDHLLKLKTICVNEHYTILYHEHSDTILYSLLQKLIRLLDSRNQYWKILICSDEVYKANQITYKD